MSYLREKTINPKLQSACFSLIHIKVQWNGAFHSKNVVKRRLQEAHLWLWIYHNNAYRNGKGGIQNIGFVNKISLPVTESHFSVTPNQNMMVNNFHLLFFSSFLWNGAHQWFWSHWWTWTFVLGCGNHIIPK